MADVGRALIVGAGIGGLAAYTALAEQSMSVPPSTFSSVEPGLFEAVAMQRVLPGPGPKMGAPERDVSPRQGG